MEKAVKMVKVHVAPQGVVAPSSRCYGFFVEADCVYGQWSKALEENRLPGLTRLLADQNFFGKLGSMAVVPRVDETGVSYYIFVGLGGRANATISIENYRRALGTIIRHVAQLKSVELALFLSQAEMFGVDDHYLAHQTAVIADMAYYHFDEFITDDNRKYPDDLLLTIVLEKHNKEQVEEGLLYGSRISSGVHFARHWVDMPPDHSTPAQLATKAREVAERNGFKYTIFNESEVNQMGLGGLAAVARGSERDCQLVVLEYTCQNPDAPTLGFVGKGITFDSGGLSLKPADYMETMKDDMAGAAAVLGAMDVLGTLCPQVNIVAVLPLAENLPSGKAIKPGDIVTFYNRKTAEILNTDAEGRLILADALSYAIKHYKLDALIDLATLTGACVVALGHFFTALLSEHDDLVARIHESSARSGERVWRLPLVDDFKAAIKSEHADIKNTGGRQYSGGTITGACFLQNFVGSVPWAHLDIAGTAFNVPDISYYRHGATGVGVRLLVDLAMNWK